MKGDISVTPSPEARALPEPERSAATAPAQPSAPVGPVAPTATDSAPAHAIHVDAIHVDAKPLDTAAIAREIGALRRGRGLRGDLARRIGPLLRELATGTRPAAETASTAPTEGSDTAEVRRRLASKLESLAAKLPGELPMAILAALAMRQETRDMRIYEERREWIAQQLDRVPRTAERRIKEAQGLLAEEIAAELTAQRSRPVLVADADRWYIEHFTADYMLDGDHPEAIEHRVIRSNVDGLAELTIALDVPVDAGQPRLPLQLEVLSGGELDLIEEKARTRTQYVIRLPQPLQAGDRHEYATRVQVLPGGPVRDYYVLRPERRCDRFDLRVRFDRRRPPAWVRRVEDEDVRFYDTYGDVPPETERVSVSHTGEATASFTGPRQHFGSGLQWGWPAPEASCCS